MRRVTLSSMKGVLFILMWALSVCMFAQTVTVRGTVADVKEEPLIGVTVQVQGTTIGTITDIEGNFIVSNVPSDAVLEVSYIGMKTQTIPINGQTTIDIVLEEAIELLEEVVAIGYGTQKKVNLTGSVSSIRYDKSLENRPITNASQALSGKIPGVWVSQNSGSPGSDGATIRIRGYGTLNNTDPLILIDGIEGQIAEINPNAITTQHNLSAQLSSNLSNTYLSVNYLKQEGIVKNTDSHRYGITVNNNMKIPEKIDIGTRLIYTRKISSQPYDGIGRVIYMMANGHPFSTPYLQDGKTFGGTMALYQSGPRAVQPIVDTRNPFPDLYNGENTYTNNFVKANFSATYKITDYLNLTAQYRTSYNFGNQLAAGAAVTALVDKNITWETTTTTDIGIDVGFLNNRLTIESDFFIKNTSDIIVQLPIPV